MVPNTSNTNLSSWKEIAVYLNRGVRTIQRWEKTEALPVRRHLHLKRGTIYAVPDELNLWLRRRQGSLQVHDALHPYQRLRQLTDRQQQLTRELRALFEVSAKKRTEAQALRSGASASTTQALDS